MRARVQVTFPVAVADPTALGGTRVCYFFNKKLIKPHSKSIPSMLHSFYAKHIVAGNQVRSSCNSWGLA